MPVMAAAWCKSRQALADKQRRWRRRRSLARALALKPRLPLYFGNLATYLHENLRLVWLAEQLQAPEQGLTQGVSITTPFSVVLA